MSGIIHTHDFAYARYLSGYNRRLLLRKEQPPLLTFEQWKRKRLDAHKRWADKNRERINRNRRSSNFLSEEERICKKCQQKKNASEFSERGYTCYGCKRKTQNRTWNRRRNEKYKYEKWYLDLHKRQSKEWRKKNPDKIRLINRKQYAKPEYLEKHRIRAAEWREKNPEKRKAQQKRSYENRKDKISEYRRKKRAKNPEFFKARDRRYYLAKKFRVSSSTEKTNAL